MKMLLSLLVACSLLSISPAKAAQPLRDKVARATEVLEKLLTGEDRPPPQLLSATSCVMVVPRIIKGAIGFGGRRGKGVVSCRNGNSWSPLAFVKITGGSFGLQIGGQSTDLVLLVVDDRSMRSLLKSKFTIGADASATAGPRSAEVQASTDIRLDAEIYSYSSSKGLFAGAALDGAKVSLLRGQLADYYNAYLRPEDILFGSVEVELPAEARRFREALP